MNKYNLKNNFAFWKYKDTKQYYPAGCQACNSSMNIDECGVQNPYKNKCIGGCSCQCFECD